MNRWRLERGEQVGDKYRPKQPITYYIDNTVPERYRAAMKAGVEAWNAAFEAAGVGERDPRAGSRPPMPDPEDIRYATLRWNTSDEPGYGAIGPSTVDPRTGEVLDADILFEASMFANYKNNWRRLAIAGHRGERVRAGVRRRCVRSADATGTSWRASSTHSRRRARCCVRHSSHAVSSDPATPFPTHSSRSRQSGWSCTRSGTPSGCSTTSARRRARRTRSSRTGRSPINRGLYSSVMEYPAVNVAAPGKPNGYFYTPGVGSYDRWAISYAYTNDAADAQRLARQAAERGHLYGTNAEAGGPGALDPEHQHVRPWRRSARVGEGAQ